MHQNPKLKKLQLKSRERKFNNKLKKRPKNRAQQPKVRQKQKQEKMELHELCRRKNEMLIYFQKKLIFIFHMFWFYEESFFFVTGLKKFK